MTQLEQAVYPRGKIAGPFPALSSRPDEAYIDFIADARNFLLHAQQYPLADYSRKLLGEAGVGMSPDPANTRRAIDVLMQDPAVKTYYRLKRSLQEAFWNRVQQSFGSRREEILKAFDAADHMGPGTVSYDDKKPLPDYARVEIHLQPGGYHHDELSGFLYHYGTKVFFRGDNDRDELHEKLVGLVPGPADGKVRRILDLACSVGQSTTTFKRRYPQAEVTGIDYSAPMVRVAHRRAAMLGDDVTFSQRLIEDTRYPDAHFDITFAFIVFHELPQRIVRETVREAARVTRPGGVFAIYDFNPSNTMSPFQLHHRDFDAAHNGEPYSQDFCDCDLDAILAEHGFSVAASPLAKRSGGVGYMKHWFATRG